VPVPRERRTETKRKYKSGKEAAVINVTQRAQIEDSTKQHLYLTKYLDIPLIKDVCRQIVKGVDFVLDRASCWTQSAAAALQDKCDDQISFADPDKLDTIIIDVSSKRAGLSAYIKEFDSLQYNQRN
jgi:hypothetical protein